MNNYTLFNILLTIFTILFLIAKAKSLKSLKITFNVSIVMTLIGYPWDFFAIKSGVWTYPNNPGLRLFNVPVNDLWFMFLCSTITTAFLYRDRINFRHRN